MSKKIILLSIVVICSFVYGCGTKKDNVEPQQVNSETLGTYDSKIDADKIIEVLEIPVAEKGDGEVINVQGGGRNGN